jgi:hypothetical protein
MSKGVDRRSFLKKAALGLFGFAILPPAKTYERVWRATMDLDGFNCVMEKPVPMLLHSEVWEIEWTDVLIETFDGEPVGIMTDPKSYRVVSKKHSVTK